MASAIYDLGEVMDRLLAMEKEVVPGEGVVYWPEKFDTFPYWMNRINGMTVEPLSADTVIDRWVMSALLVIDHMTANYVGTVFKVAQETYIPAVLQFFDDNPLLTSAAYPDEMLFVFPDEDTRGAHITGLPSGTRTVLNTGIGVKQVVLEFTISVPLGRKQY